MRWHDGGDIVARFVRAAPNPFHEFKIVLVLASKHRPSSYTLGSALDGLLRIWSKQDNAASQRQGPRCEGTDRDSLETLLCRSFSFRVNLDLPVDIKLSSKTASSSVMAVFLVHTTTRFLAPIHGYRSLYNRVTPGSYEENL